MEYIEIKEYDTLRITMEYQDTDGVPLPLTNTLVTSTMQSINYAVPIKLNIEQLDILAGNFLLTADIAHIMPTDYRIDVLFEDVTTGTRIASETFGVKVIHSVTIPLGVT